MVELPSGTVTFLFTDVAGSTRLWEEHPDAMRDTLARHDVLFREAIEAHGGYVVKTTGDGFHATFATADAGVVAAVAAQRALESEDWPLPEPLRVRMGLHTGAASLRDGDYFGSAVNRAARLEAIAHGGQVVCSQAAADLARDTLTEGVALVDLGEHRLRDLSRPERVFQVNAPGLVDTFARLRTLDAFPSNLPAQLSSFVGHERGRRRPRAAPGREAVGDPHRCRWCRQDPARAAGRGGGVGSIPRTVRGCASWRRCATRLGRWTRSRRCSRSAPVRG